MDQGPALTPSCFPLLRGRCRETVLGPGFPPLSLRGAALCLPQPGWAALSRSCVAVPGALSAVPPLHGSVARDALCVARDRTRPALAQLCNG